MGGSGSSGGWSPSGSNGGGSDPCDLRFQADLFAPVPSVVKGLKRGERLSVQLITQGQSQSVGALTQSGAVAGTITGVRQLGALINCLGQHDYEAEVTAISGSKVTVVVERV